MCNSPPRLRHSWMLSCSLVSIIYHRKRLTSQQGPVLASYLVPARSPPDPLAGSRHIDNRMSRFSSNRQRSAGGLGAWYLYWDPEARVCVGQYPGSYPGWGDETPIWLSILPFPSDAPPPEIGIVNHRFVSLRPLLELECIFFSSSLQLVHHCIVCVSRLRYTFGYTLLQFLGHGRLLSCLVCC